MSVESRKPVRNEKNLEMVTKVLVSVKDWCLYDPRRIVRIIVLIVCFCVVLVQFLECFKKLQHPPKSTRTQFDINETMHYPALTFCRDPPYKASVLSTYNFNEHPKYTSDWQSFPFGDVTMKQFFEEATYEQNEFFYQFGLNKNTSNIEISSSLHFYYGRCYTLKPTVNTRAAWKDVGYSVLLKHDTTDHTGSSSTFLPGWHLFIHEVDEPFSENRFQTSGRVEHMFIEVYEEVEIKLSALNYIMTSNVDSKCTEHPEKSISKCGEICHWQRVTNDVKCRGPWMDIDIEECSDYASTTALINAYKEWDSENDVNCGCAEPCDSIIYSSYVLNRKYHNISVPTSQIYVFYTTKVYSIIEEIPGYDLSQFVADMGGSMGFLLGLSVLGVIGLFEKTMALVVGSRRNQSGKRPVSPESVASFSPNLSLSKASGDSASTAIATEKESG